MKFPINFSLDYMDYINYYTYFLETHSGKTPNLSNFIYFQYYDFMIVDSRTSKWFLMGSPGPVLTIIATYLYFCMYAGPRYMKDRKPFDLKNAIIIYNGLQFIFSVILVYEVPPKLNHHLN